MTTPSTRGRLYEARTRRLLYLVLAVIAAVLIVVPRPHVARARLLPQDASVGGSAGMLGPAPGSAQHLGDLLAGQPTSERHLVLARDEVVKADAVGTLGLVGPGRFGSVSEAVRWLDRSADVHPLPGGVIEVENVHADPETARRMTAAYADAIARHLADVSGAPVRIVDPATVLPERRYNVRAAAALALVLLLALFTEWYAPAAGLIPPARRTRRTEEFA